MILALSIILFLLLALIGKKRGIKTFVSFYVSFLLICIFVLLMGFGINALLLSLGMCILASWFILFFLNGNNIKTKTAFISIIVVFLIIFVLTFIIVKLANIQGFSQDSIESIGGFYLDISYDMSDVLIAVYLLGILGTIIDTAMSISSALYEVYDNNRNLNTKELYISGMNIGKDILGTTINTLFFALVITFIGFFLWHRDTAFWYILNYKVFCQDVINLLICFISSVAIIPITSKVCSLLYVKHFDYYK